MQFRFHLAILLLLCVACTNEKKASSDIADRGISEEVQFDKSNWRSKEGLDYPYRAQMLNDLVYNDTVRSLNKDEILDLLGEPDRRNDGYLYYMIAQRRLGSWPLHTKSLVINLSDDSTIVWIKIHE